ncbi:MAG: DUF1254 domain-containing protein [Caulobacterales bacterium]
MNKFVLSRRHLMLAGAATAISAAACSKPAPAASASLAEDAAIWGFPLVLTGRYLELAKKSGSTLNQFYLNPNLATPSLKVPGPNIDTIYGYAWLDIAKEPVILDVPDVGDRYYSIQLLDAYENTFQYVGSRETGYKAGSYAITGPGWTGSLPDGVTQVQSPTTLVFVLTRTLVRSVADAPAAQKVQLEYTLAPLSNYPAGKAKGIIVNDALNVLPALDLSDAGPTYFDELNALVAKYPPTGPEAETFKTFAVLGLGSDDFAKKAPPKADLEAAFTNAYRRIREKDLFAQNTNGWKTNYSISKFIKDPLARAAVDQYGPGAHIAEEALYFSALTDGNGAELTGDKRYTLTFPAGQLPPVDGFWSVIVYDSNFFLVDNPINRYGINDRTPGLKKAPDGSLTLVFQHDAPKDKSNWLPTPKGSFRVLARAYEPKQAFLDKSYVFPSIAGA